MKRPDSVLLAGVAGFLSGVFIASFLFGGYALSLFLLCVAGAFLLLSRMKEHERFFFLASFLALLAAGIARYEYWDRSFSVAPGPVSGEYSGVIIAEPDVREKGTQLAVRIDGTGSAALLFVDRYPEYHYGDRIAFFGKLEAPESFSEEDGRVFDYPMYLRVRGITLRSFRPEVRLLGEGNGNPLPSALFAIKGSFVDRLGGVFPEPESALAGGILLGAKRSLGQEWTERFRRAGIAHIVVLSGYNMTVVADWLGRIFLPLGFRGSIGISALGIVLFALLAGGGATVWRAAILALLALFARLTGRTGTAGRMLFIAAGAMVALNPGILAHDPSFQLSFLASLGLVYITPILERRFRAEKNPGFFREIALSTVSTQIAVLPLLLWKTGLLSLVALPVNLLVLPVIPFTMLSAFLAGFAAYAGDIAGTLAGIPAHTALSYILGVARVADEIPFGNVAVPPFSGTLVALLYGILAVGVIVAHRRHPPEPEDAPTAQCNDQREKRPLSQ
jgi:competence protein ComEC